MPTEETKVKFAYQITVYEDGGIDVTPVEVEGCETPSNEDMFKNVREVADRIHMKEISNAAYLGTLRALEHMSNAAEAQ